MGRKGKKKGGDRALPVGMSAASQQSAQSGLRQQAASSSGRQQITPGSSQQVASSSERQQSTPISSQQSFPPGIREQAASSSALQQPISRTSQQSVHPEATQKTKEKPQRQEISAETLGIEFKKFQLSSPLPRKPGINKSGKEIRLISNCFPLRLPSGNVYHYDVEISLKKRSTTTMEEKVEAKDKKFRCLNTRENRKVFDRMVREHPLFENILPAYDGMKSMYTRKPLRFSESENALTIKVVMPETITQPKKFEVCIKPVVKKGTNGCAISLDPLHSLFSGRVSSVPRETIMAIETIMKHYQALRPDFTPLGHSFFYQPKYPYPLGSCKEIYFGHHQSVRLGQKTPMVNLDISASTFYEKGPLQKYIATFLDKDVEALRSVSTIEPRIRQNLNKMLKNLRVETDHQGYRREYRILKLTERNASSIEFKPNGATENTNVAAHFSRRWNRTLRFPNLPCVQVHPVAKLIFIPIEMCKVVPGQRYNGLLQGEETAKMVKDTARPPSDRFREIKTIFNEKTKYNQDPVLREFGFSVDPESLRVTGRRMIEPTIKYHETSGDSIVRPRNGSWDMRDRKVLEGASVHSWALVDFAGRNPNSFGPFCEALSSFGGRQGMYLGKCKNISSHRVPWDVNQFDSFVEKIFRDLMRVYQIGLVVAIIPMKLRRESPRDDDKTKVLYRTVKDVSMRLDIVSQCVKEKNVTQNPSLVSNILLKINAKMGGTNNSLTSGEIPSFMRNGMMIVGADVTHPSPSKDIACSLAAVVGSMNPEFSIYEVISRAQINKEDPKTSKEVIEDMTAIMLELLAAYRKKNGQNPTRIVVFRDGVSDGEFEEVQETEIDKIKEAFRRVEPNYNPGVTYIVIQKRHHVRTVPENPRDGVGKMGNPPPGTVVDTVITHPLNYDFYMYPHFGLQGTSRPAYMTVVRDDNSISPEDMHKMSYYLCHTYARCTKSISSPAPARYADLAAFMARQILLKHKSSWADVGEDFEKSRLTKKDLTEINNLLKAMKFEHIV